MIHFNIVGASDTWL